MKDNFIIRELKESDFEIGYMDCVNELTNPVQINYQTFLDRFNLLKNKKDYFVIVVEDKENNKIIEVVHYF